MTVDPGNSLTEGIRLLQTGNVTAAAEFFHKATQADPTNGQAFGYFGITLAKLGDLDNAIPALQYAARLQPADAGSHYNLALALMQAGRTAEARTSLEQALGINPAYAQARAALDSLLVAAAPAPTPFGAPPALKQPLDPDYQPDAPNPFAQTSAMPSQPANYFPPPGQAYPSPLQPYAGTQSGTPYSGQYPLSAGGMQYPSRPMPVPVAVEPGLGLRLLRGLGWGALYGQWWTVWMIFWTVAWGFSDVTAHTAFYILLFVAFCVVFMAGGAILGLILALLRANPEGGGFLGIIVGVIFFALEMWLTQASPSAWVNVIFWFYTGRFVGTNVAARIMQPVYR